MLQLRFLPMPGLVLSIDREETTRAFPCGHSRFVLRERNGAGNIGRSERRKLLPGWDRVLFSEMRKGGDVVDTLNNASVMEFTEIIKLFCFFL